MKIVTRFFVLLMLVLSAKTACAGPTGLIVIPIAETREPDTYEIEWQHDGKAGVPLNPDANYLNTQFGIVNRVEAGVDFTLKSDPNITYLNWKYSFPFKKVLVGVGTYNISGDTKPINYIVSSSIIGSLPVHLGAQRSNGKTELIAGTHYHLGRTILMADYISGDENFASAGFEYVASDKFAIQWGILFPNEGNDRQFTLHLIYNSRFTRF